MRRELVARVGSEEKNVVVEGRADGRWRVVIANRGTMVMPAELKVTFDDGSAQTVRLPVEMWNLGPRFTYSL
ncbi:MAG TPA: hypothetical protein VL172_06630, partial [Kofleriaceae bacterium]|nr:hypothetical protein [Kofleriaceae bacterium]